MQIVIEFSCDNAAFEDDFEGEIKLVLSRAQKAIDRGFHETAPLYDTNGNRIGSVMIGEGK